MGFRDMDAPKINTCCREKDLIRITADDREHKSEVIQPLFIRLGNSFLTRTLEEKGGFQYGKI